MLQKFYNKIIEIFMIESNFSKKESNLIKYKIIDCHKNAKGQQIVVAQIVDSARAIFKMPASKIVMERKDILAQFSIEDITNIIGIVNSEKEPKVIYKKIKIYKYDNLLAMLFGVMLITTNIVSIKLTSIFGITMTGAVTCYAFMYLIGDIITEVYGYKKARQLIWGAVFCNLVMLFFIQIAIALPPSDLWHNQKEFSLILGAVPRIILASITAYWCGEFINSYVIAKSKIHHKGEKLFFRLLSATLVGNAIDTIIFGFLAYSDIMPLQDLIFLILRMYCKKIIQIIILLPIAVFLIKKLKEAEKVDIIDTDTNFSPFLLDLSYTDSNNLIYKSVFLNKKTG